MSSYMVRPGDTWDLIARKTYGTGAEASLLQSANPGALEPLSPGTQLFTPELVGEAQAPTPTTSVVNIDETAVNIDGDRFRFWKGISVTRALDSISSAQLEAPSDLANKAFPKAFKPMSFTPLEVLVGGAPFFSGTMMLPASTLDAVESKVSMECYGKAGVLIDCNAPSSSFPIEFNDSTVLEIAQALAKPFGIEVVSEADVGATFDRVAIKAQDKVFPFLAGLARQRKLVLGDDPQGRLVLRQSVAVGSPVAVLIEGGPGFTEITDNLSPQQYFSHVTGLREPLIGSIGEQYTVKNSRLSGVLRPFVFQADDTEDGNLQAAVEMKAGLMVGNSISYDLQVPGWRDPAGNHWEPNTTIKVGAPSVNISKPYEFLVRAVQYDQDPVSNTAVLTLVLPGSFSGKLPEALPWD